MGRPASADDLFHLLQSSRRRAVLRYLRGHEGLVRMRDVAEQVAAWENDTTVARLTSDERQRVYISLYQSHLERLKDADVIEYNKPCGVIKPRPLLEHVAAYVDTPWPDATDEGEASDGDTGADVWSQRYLGAMAVSGLLFIETALGLLSSLAVGVLVLVLFTGGTVAKLTLDERDRLGREFPKVPPLRNREMDAGAKSTETDVLAELEATAESDDGGNDSDPDQRDVREIRRPEGVSADHAAEVLKRYAEMEKPTLVSADALPEGFGDGETPADTYTRVSETQSGRSDSGSGFDSDSDEDEGTAFNLSDLTLTERDTLQQKRCKVVTFRTRGMSRADTLEAVEDKISTRSKPVFRSVSRVSAG